jgi:hypothetical protein
MRRRVLVAAGVVVLATGIVTLWLGLHSLPEVKSPEPRVLGGNIRLQVVRIPNEGTGSVPNQAPARAPSSWCAPTRRNEPLLRYAISFGTERDSAFERQMNGIRSVQSSSIVVVKDEGVCRDAAMAYNGDTGDVGPVLVIRIDTRYLVGKPGFRDAADAYWLIQIYDEEWNLLTSYSQGS